MTKHASLKSIFGLALVFGVTSCDDDETKVQNAITTTQFIRNQISILENEGSGEVSIALTQPATQQGIITISANAGEFNGFTTNPEIVDGKIELNVSPGTRNVSFSFNPIDNNVLNENQLVSFSIESVSEGFEIGSTKVLSVVIIDNEAPASVSFENQVSAALENSGSPTTVAIALSHSAPGTGSIEILLDSEDAVYGTHYVTEPAATGGKIIVPVAFGVNRVEFKVIPLNDQLFNGHRNVQYTISRTEGPFTVGTAVTNTLKITDDELLGKGKGYTIGGGGWGYKKEYQYNEAGLISKVLFEQSSTGSQLNGYYNYEYNASGNLIKMNSFDLTETIYSWENGQIVKEETFRDGILKKYVLYGYDDAGNVGEAAYYYRQPDGELKLSTLIVFLYYQDGNIFKHMIYSPIEGSEEYNLLATKTFESYSTKANPNPFTMVEILPGKVTQPNLPLSYRVEEGGVNILYQFTYQFNKDGKPTRRTATSSAGSETVVYEYY